ncbi:MAG: hypothetical protein KC547_17630 [Anaerolineae bacterium]|nr:hypothetical protein [Anaerolineae bacterium]
MLKRWCVLLLFVAMIMLPISGTGISAAQPETAPCDLEAEYTDFGNPERVTIQGYDDHAMEPFLTRAGAYLLFNNRNDPSTDTNLHWARRIDDLTFEYLGEIDGVATTDLEGVPTMDSQGTLYFVSTRSYFTTFSTLYTGQFDEGTVTDVRLVPGISLETPGIVNFDVEVSADGTHLYFVDALFDQNGRPLTADLVIAERQADGFVRLPESVDLLANVNSDILEYAAAISNDERELFFTRVDFEAVPLESPKIYRAYRESVDEPFGCPARVTAMDGFVEAATFSPDEQALYYHKLENQRYVIYRVTRAAM